MLSGAVSLPPALPSPIHSFLSQVRLTLSNTIPHSGSWGPRKRDSWFNSITPCCKKLARDRCFFLDLEVGSIRTPRFSKYLRNGWGDVWNGWPTSPQPTPVADSPRMHWQVSHLHKILLCRWWDKEKVPPPLKKPHPHHLASPPVCHKRLYHCTGPPGK